jgi:hypothetical protein
LSGAPNPWEPPCANSRIGWPLSRTAAAGGPVARGRDPRKPPSSRPSGRRFRHQPRTVVHRVPVTAEVLLPPRRRSGPTGSDQRGEGTTCAGIQVSASLNTQKRRYPSRYHRRSNKFLGECRAVGGLALYALAKSLGIVRDSGNIAADCVGMLFAPPVRCCRSQRWLTATLAGTDPRSPGIVQRTWRSPRFRSSSRLERAGAGGWRGRPVHLGESRIDTKP